MGQPVHQLLIATDKVERELGREEHCSLYGYNATTFFPKSTNEVFSGQGAWHSPNLLPTIVQGQVCRIIT